MRVWLMHDGPVALDVVSAKRLCGSERVAVPFPIERGAAIPAEMKSNAIAAVGIALVNLPLTVKPHLLFRKRRAEMEGRAGALRAWDEFDRHGSPAPL